MPACTCAHTPTHMLMRACRHTCIYMSEHIPTHTHVQGMWVCTLTHAMFTCTCRQAHMQDPTQNPWTPHRISRISKRSKLIETKGCKPKALQNKALKEKEGGPFIAQFISDPLWLSISKSGHRCLQFTFQPPSLAKFLGA